MSESKQVDACDYYASWSIWTVDIEKGLDNRYASKTRSVLRYNEGTPEYMPNMDYVDWGERRQNYKIRWKLIEYVSSGPRTYLERSIAAKSGRSRYGSLFRMRILGAPIEQGDKGPSSCELKIEPSYLWVRIQLHSPQTGFLIRLKRN